MNANAFLRFVMTTAIVGPLVLIPSLKSGERKALSAEPKVHINGYSNIVIPDAQSDPYEIGPALREAAEKRGLRVFVSGHDISESELVKTCVAAWGWTRVGLASGTVQMRVYDGLSRNLIVDVHSRATAWWTAHGAVNQAVKKLIEETGYTKYSDEQHRKNIELLFPTRPKMEFGEKGFRDHPPTSDIEGLWSDERNEYTVAITKTAEPKEFDYVAVIISTNSPVWSPGEIKMELKKTAAPTVFVGNYYAGNKKRQGITYAVEGGALLKFTFVGPSNESVNYNFIKSWPTREISGGNYHAPADLKATKTGTGFLISSDGLIATNWHVADGASEIRVQFPWQQSSSLATVVIKDPANDLAILRVSDFGGEINPCSNLPYQVKKAASAKLGGKIFTIGYPLEGLLGAGPKYTEGSISSLSGLMDDIRCLQISASIQPGNSGSPLFDGDGDVIGIIVSTLSPAIQYKMTETLPQNVNFAIKADYLLNLIEMLPNKPNISVQKRAGASEVGKCVGLVRIIVR